MKKRTLLWALVSWVALYANVGAQTYANNGAKPFGPKPSQPSQPTLGPTRPSQLVNLRISSRRCGGASNVFAFAVRQTSDATSELFVIPEGEVFVLTQVRASLVGQPNVAGSAGILIGDDTRDVSVDQFSAVADASGNYALNVTFSPGVVIRSGLLPCFSTFGTTFGFIAAYAYGFLAIDQ